MISRIGTMHPHLGYIVNPITETATGTSSLQGRAADATKQQQCPCALRTEQPSHSILGPQQQQGRQGAPGLQQYSMLRQHRPTLPEQPQQSEVG